MKLQSTRNLFTFTYPDSNSQAAICTIEKITSKVYGECLLSQALDGTIKLWSSQSS